MPDEQLSALERECVDHFLRWLRGFTTAREMWYLIALEQEHFASREALQMMEHVEKQPKAAEVVAQCPKCNGNMRWADSVHNAIRCEACQYLMVSISAHNHVAKASEVQP